MTKALNAVIKAIGYLLRVMILLTVVFIAAQIIWRYVFRHPLLWTEQVSSWMFVWMILLGFPVLYHNKKFMAFDTLLEALPFKVKETIKILMKVVICCFCAYWFYAAAWLISGTYKQYTAGVRIPYYFLYGAQNLSALLIFWVVATQLVQEIKAILDRKTAPAQGQPQT